MLTWPKLVLLNGPSSESCGIPSPFPPSATASFQARVADFTDVFSGFSRRANPTVDVWT